MCNRTASGKIYIICIRLMQILSSLIELFCFFQNYFQRAARTDKSVSAAGQLCSSMISIIIYCVHCPILFICPCEEMINGENGNDGVLWHFCAQIGSTSRLIWVN